MFCKECGKEIDENAKFCSICGAKQPEKLKPKPIVAEKPKEEIGKQGVLDKPIKKATKPIEEEQPKNDPIPLRKKRKCPYCGSHRVGLEEKPFRKGMLLLGVVGAVIEAKRNRGFQYVCRECGEKWDKE